jgi:ribosomal protein S18 acetylase RimI-like enzyme
MIDITIEDIRESDLDEIIQMGLSTPELHVDSEPVYYSKSQLESFLQSPDDIHIVARIDGKIAGYRLATCNIYLKEAYLIDLVVKPEYRRMGVATKLYKETFRRLTEKDIQWAWCLIKDENVKMKEFAESKGFSRGTQFNFYYKVAPF